MAKSLHAYCPRCKKHPRVDSFAGGTVYDRHLMKDGERLCKNSGQPCYYKARDWFAGAPTVAEARGKTD